MMKKTVLMALFATLFSGAVLAAGATPAPTMLHKHKLECSACHKTQVGSPVPTAQCRTCHAQSQFEQGIELKNGEANPHVSLHYDPATVDCNLCHREHSQSVNYCTACHADGLKFKVP